MPKFMISVRSIANGDFAGGLGKIRYLVVPDGAAPLPEQEIPLRAWMRQLLATFPRDAASVARGDAVCFIHGFNTSAADVADRHGLIAAGLARAGFIPTLVSFGWPSAGSVFAYLEDLDIAKRTAIDFVNAAVRPMLAAQTPDCQVVIHALCHSLGAYVLREALDHADDGIVTGSEWMLGQLVLVAGDVEASDFVDGNKDTQSMLGHAYRLTNYYNLYDQVLQISKAKSGGVEERVGRIGLPANAPRKTVNLDCSRRYKQIEDQGGFSPVTQATFSHDWYFSDEGFYADLAQTLRGAVDRTVVTGRVARVGGSLELGT
jgi:Alpha/beta hydrolase of unknown function (DUF900)